MVNAANANSAEGPCWLVAGARGMVGRCLIERMAGSVPPVRILALSRGDPPSWAMGVAVVGWRRGDLYRDALIDPVSTLLSAGPLDGLVQCLERHKPPGLRRVVALSSTSLHVKRGSPDARERDLAQQLADAESRLAAWCAAAGVGWTILRPTLIYDDREGGALGAIARLRRRFGCMPAPAGLRGLRQPVHADDVAGAMLAVAVTAAGIDRAYDLPGGECLSHGEMLRRYLRRDGSAARVWPLPPRAFAVAAAIARRFGLAPDATDAALSRLEADLVFDAAAAARDFGYAPRAFVAGGAGSTPRA